MASLNLYSQKVKYIPYPPMRCFLTKSKYPQPG